ncbi:MAG: response regulator [Roseofilum sp. SBFL]|uniref:response regulator n=1 Tax=unclassified Roseofilum TaxID=2620099 RepID=UPI001B02C84B|nr:MULTISPECIES: response regulator [unclassified Roseofilum]MBP0011813.1 response regulator [Roseofilum sp. SID3]MBP0023314.1 response regulator [Roseofilum sp. SID2]MBP0043704.1 response regulator [Roseofilum sp. SBFL]
MADSNRTSPEENAIVSYKTSKILVVDDVPENLRLLKTLLKNEGYDVRFAPNAKFALASLTQFVPDLILLDIMMPEMDGYTLCEQLKGNPETQDIPIIFLTALNEEADKVKGFQLGAVDYITKPFQSEEVLVRVAHHLKLTQLNLQLQEKNQILLQKNHQLQEAERETRLLLEVTQYLTQASTWENAIAQIIKSICDRIFWDYGEAWLPQEETQTLSYLPNPFATHPTLKPFCKLSSTLEFQAGEGLPGKIWQNQTLEWIQDITQAPGEPYTRQSLAVQIGLKCAFGMPILVNQKVMAILVFYQTQITPCQLNIVALVQAIGSQISFLIQRKQSELQLQQQAQDLAEALHQLKTTQIQLIQSEKMSSLGQLVAGISHEINNPVNFIAGNIDHLESYIHDLIQVYYAYQQSYPIPAPTLTELIADLELDFTLTDLPNVILSMKSGTERITKIVNSLRRFAHLDESQLKTVDIHDEIESVLTILNNRLKLESSPEMSPVNFSEIKVERDYGQLPKFDCFAGELNQAFMQILMNGIDALQERYEVEKKQPNFPYILGIKTQWIQNSSQVQIQISDNGMGIPANIKPRIFDPFFTTKPVGKGTGMGMAISYQIIVEKHGGSLKCLDIPGQTTFAIALPQRPKKQ